MTDAVLGKAARKLFEKHLHQYAPADPLYEYYTDERGRKKKKKRDVPPGLSARDELILRSVNRRAHYLDKGFQFCGMRFGWTAIIGIVPGAGDVADIALNYYLVVLKARQAELPGWLVRRMLFNNSISALVGFVPFAGDIVLAQFKANSRNAALLEEFLRIRGQVYLEMKAEGKDVRQVGAPKPPAKKKKSLVKGKKIGEKEVDVPKITVEPEAAPAKAEGGSEAAAQAQEAEAELKQIKPGAGLASGEVISAPRPPSVTPTENSVAAEEPAPTVTKFTGKRKLSLPQWRGKPKDPQPVDKGKFVENIGANAGANAGGETVVAASGSGA